MRKKLKICNATSKHRSIQQVSIMKKWINVCGLGLVLVLAPLAANSAPTATPIKASARVYIAQEESSRRALENMLDMLGYKLNASGLSNQPISGKFEFSTVEEVMAYFKSSFRINWFQNGTQVFVYRSDDWQTQKVYVGGGQRTNDDWKDLLTSSGLYYKEFPFAINSENKELIISGPRSYLKLVRETFEQTPPDPSEIEKHGIELMVYPLLYASVEDRQTTLRGTTLTTPGVLSVLLNLLGLPNQRMTASPENKKAGMITDGNALSAAGRAGSFSQAPNMAGQAGYPMGVNSNAAAGMQPGGAQQQNGAKDKNEQPISITADPRTNTILVRDAKSKYEYYKQLIDKLDRPLPMIEVEAMLIEIDQRGLNELGLEFGFQSKHFQYEFPGSAVSNNSLLSPGASTIVDPIRFLARIKALAADENAKVLARPTIVTQDNVAAYIDLSQTLYLQVTGERVANVETVTAGSLLQVTPRLIKEGDDDKIFVRIDIQDGSLSSATTSSANNSSAVINSPTIQNTALSTQALVQREKAILIGGYNRESTSEQDYKVPVLGSIPIVGRLFSSKQTNKQTLVRLFLITPRLIDEPPHNSASTRNAVTTLQKSFKVNGEFLQPTPTLRLDRSISR
jgi:type III secretion protein C